MEYRMDLHVLGELEPVSDWSKLIFDLEWSQFFEVQFAVGSLCLDVFSD